MLKPPLDVVESWSSDVHGPVEGPVDSVFRFHRLWRPIPIGLKLLRVVWGHEHVLKGRRGPGVRAWLGNGQLPSLVFRRSLRPRWGGSVVILVPRTGYVSTFGPLATSIVITVPVPAETAARLLGWVLRSKTAFGISSPTFSFFSFSLLSLGVEGIGGIRCFPPFSG